MEYRRLGVYRVLYLCADGRIWASSGYDVLLSDDNGETFRHRARLDRSRLLSVMVRWSLAERAARAGFLGLLPLPDGTVLGTVRGAILRCSPDSNDFQPVLLTPGRTMKLEKTPDGTVFAGEYFFNHSRREVRILMSGDSGFTWSVVHRFPPGEVRHVHNLVYDGYRAVILVLTGDRDHESKLIAASDGFKNLRVLTEGSQRSRSMDVIPTANGLLFATDTPYLQNYIQLLRPDGTLETRCPIAGSCLASARAGNWYLFGTASEPSKVNLDKSVFLYGSKDGLRWTVIERWRADRWSGGSALLAALFQMSRVSLPRGNNPGDFIFATTVAVRGADGVLHRWEIA